MKNIDNAISEIEMSHGLSGSQRAVKLQRAIKLLAQEFVDEHHQMGNCIEDAIEIMQDTIDEVDDVCQNVASN